jgi:hypothetical protein
MFDNFLNFFILFCNELNESNASRFIEVIFTNFHPTFTSIFIQLKFKNFFNYFKYFFYILKMTKMNSLHLTAITTHHSLTATIFSNEQQINFNGTQTKQKTKIYEAFTCQLFASHYSRVDVIVRSSMSLAIGKLFFLVGWLLMIIDIFALTRINLGEISNFLFCLEIFDLEWWGWFFEGNLKSIMVIQKMFE